MSTIEQTQTVAPVAHTSRFSKLFSASTPVWRVALLAVVLGAVAAEIWGALAMAAGVEMIAGSNFAEPHEITPGNYAAGVISWAWVGVALASGLARWATSPKRTWTVTTWTLTVISLAGPLLMATDATTGTKVVLALAHIVAAGAVIPFVAKRLEQPRKP